MQFLIAFVTGLSKLLSQLENLIVDTMTEWRVYRDSG